jgi:hypothetical protein
MEAKSWDMDGMMLCYLQLLRGGVERSSFNWRSHNHRLKIALKQDLFVKLLTENTKLHSDAAPRTSAAFPTAARAEWIEATNTSVNH